MEIENESTPEDTVTFSFPQILSNENTKTDLKKNKEKLSTKMLNSKSSEHNNLLFQKSLEFDDQVNQLIISNFQLVKKIHFSFFLHLIIFPPANMDEKFFFFANSGLVGNHTDDSVNYTVFKVASGIGIQHYLQEFLRIKTEIDHNITKVRKNVLCVFENFLNFGAENFEKLIILLNEEVISVLKDNRFCLLVSVLEGNQYSFQIKNMYLEKTHYYSHSVIFFEFLFEILKGGIGNYIFFSPEFFRKAIQHNKDYLGTLQFERQKWEIYKKIAIFRNKQKIDDFEENKTLKDSVDISYLRFKWALKVLSKFIRITSQKSESETSILIMNFIAGGYRESLLNYTAFFANKDEFFSKLPSVFPAVSTLKKFSNDQIFKKKTENFWKIIEGKIEQSANQGLSSVSVGNQVQKIDRAELALGICKKQTNEFTTQFQRLKKCLLETFEGLVEGHFRFIAEKTPFLWVNDYFEFNAFVNPDFYGSFYRAMQSFNNPNEAMFVVKVFFDVLKEKPEKCSAQEIVLTLHGKLKAIPHYSALDEDAVIDVYLYCQQLFEHFHLSKLTHKGVYFLEKNFFGKYGRKTFN